MTIALWTAAIALVLLGIAGTLLPALPGVPLVFGGLLLAAWIDGFAKVTPLSLVVLGAMTLGALLIDFLAAVYGAKRVKASPQAIAGALIGTIVGIAGGFFGILLGPLVGAFLGEFIAQEKMKAADPMARAGQVGFATWVGMILGVAAKLAMSFAMVAIFITAYFWG